MKRILAATTILAAIGSPAFATGYNDLFIDAQTAGSVAVLSVTQDHTGGNNLVNSTGSSSSTTKFPVKGAWNAITINQTGSGNKLYGGIKTASANGTTNAVLNANYTSTGAGGANKHSLNVGVTAAPLDPTINIYVSNVGTGTNTITDTTITTAKGVINPGEVAAIRFTINGIYRGQPRICLERVNRVGEAAAPDWPRGNQNDVYRVEIDGSPSITQETAFRFTDGSGRDAAAAGCLATGLRALNAVPAVNDLPPGWVTALDLPLIPGVGTIR